MAKNEDKNLIKNDVKPILGIYAKSSTTLEDEHQAKNSINTKVTDNKKKDKKLNKEELKNINQKNRIKRYILLRNGRKIFLNYATETKIRTCDLHKLSRTINCKYALSAGYENVEVHCDNKTAYYVGLQTCGSVWTCPICAARVAEVRRKEIEQAVGNAYSKGFQSVMVTLTFPHTKKISLKELLNKQSLALKYFRSGNAWTCFKNKIDFQGLVRALELTYGANGWHPHTHELWFVAPTLKEKDIKKFITKRWINCLEKAGLISNLRDKITNDALNKRSVDIKMSCKSSDYLSKNDNLNWGIDRELAKAANKGKSKGLHPFELLEVITEEHSKLFIEYAQAMKGKSQLFWSHGLKEKLEVSDVTDEEICEEKENLDDEEKLFDREIYFTDEEWEVIVKRELRAQVLNMFENSGKHIDLKYQMLLDDIAVKVKRFKEIKEERKRTQKANPVLKEHLHLIDDCPF